MTVIRYFRKVQHLPVRESNRVSNLESISNGVIHNVRIEQCFYVDIGERKDLCAEELKKLEWLLTNPLDRTGLSQSNFLDKKHNSVLIEIGPR